MRIRRAKEEDLGSIKSIYALARKYMKENGNPTQWENGYPSETTIREDLILGNCYVIEEEEIFGVFVFILGDEPTYQVIENGSWTVNEKYGTIHRIASSGMRKGIAKSCFDFCLRQVDYLRIDTHENNLSMQRAILNYGFKYCGQIQVRNGKRMAFDYLSRRGVK